MGRSLNDAVALPALPGAAGSTTSPAESLRIAAAGLVGPAALFIAALLTRLFELGNPALQADELLHLYAARSVLHDNTLTIFSGVYERAADFSHLVAASLWLFGDGPATLRLPSAIAGALLVALVYAWLRAEAGRGPAVLAALLLCFMAPAVDLAQFARPYAVQGLLFFVGAGLLYRLVARTMPWPTAAFSAAVAVVTLVEAIRLEMVTAVGLAALSIWLALYLTWRVRARVPLWALALAWLSALAAIAIALQTETGAALWQDYRSARLWALPNRDDPLYYYHQWGKAGGLMLDLLPVAAAAAIAIRPRVALHCSAMLTVGLLLHSFAGMKADRFAAYLLPYYACIWGVAAWPLLTGLRQLATTRLVALGVGRAGLRLFDAALLGVCAISVVHATPMLVDVWRDILIPSYDRPRVDNRQQSWREAGPALRDLARRSALFVADDELLADYYVARPDLVWNQSRLLEARPSVDFARDHRTGLPVIGSNSSLERAFACFDSGLLLLANVPAPTLALIQSHARAIPVEPPLAAFTWSGRQGPPGQDCSGLHEMIASTQERRGAASGRTAP